MGVNNLTKIGYQKELAGIGVEIGVCLNSQLGSGGWAVRACFAYKVQRVNVWIEESDKVL